MIEHMFDVLSGNGMEGYTGNIYHAGTGKKFVLLKAVQQQLEDGYAIDVDGELIGNRDDDDTIISLLDQKPMRMRLKQLIKRCSLSLAIMETIDDENSHLSSQYTRSCTLYARGTNMCGQAGVCHSRPLDNWTKVMFAQSVHTAVLTRDFSAILTTRGDVYVAGLINENNIQSKHCYLCSGINRLIAGETCIAMITQDANVCLHGSLYHRHRFDERVNISGGNVQDVALGIMHALFLTHNGLYGIGFANKYQLGELQQKVILKPTLVPDLPVNCSSIASIRCSSSASAVITTDHVMYTIGHHDGIINENWTRYPQPVADVFLSVKSSTLLLPTSIQSISPKLVLNSGTQITIAVSGICDLAFISFEYGGELISLEATVDNSSRITLKTPKFTSIASSPFALVRISCDGQRYSNPVAITVVYMPQNLTISPECGPTLGNSRVCIIGSFLNVPYEKIIVHVLVNGMQAIECVATFNSQLSAIVFFMPPCHLNTSSLLSAKLALGLDGQTFVELPVTFSYYYFTAHSISTHYLPMSGGFLWFRSAGVHFARQLSAKFVVRTGYEHIVPAWFVDVASMEYKMTARNKAAAAAENSIAEVNHPTLVLSNDQSANEEIEKFQAQNIDFLASLLPNEKDHAGFICCVAPSFEITGVDNVRVSLSQNGQDYCLMPFTLEVVSPFPTFAYPSIVPTSGNTTIRIFGQYFYAARQIQVRILPKSQSFQNECASVSESILPSSAPDKPLKSPSSTGNRTNPISPRKDSTGILSKKTPTIIGSSVCTCVSTSLPLPLFIDASYHVQEYGPSFLSFKSPKDMPVGSFELAVAFDPHANAFSHSTVTIACYSEPLLLDVDQSTIPLAGGVNVSLFGCGFIPSEAIAVRLTMLPLEEDNRHSGGRATSRADTASSLHAPTSSKSLSLSNNPTVQLIEIPEAVSIVIAARFIDGTKMLPDEREKRIRDLRKVLKKSMTSHDEMELSSIVFNMPAASRFQRPDALPDPLFGSLRSLDIELALDGQTFVKNSSGKLQLKYEKAAIPSKMMNVSGVART